MNLLGNRLLRTRESFITEANENVTKVHFRNVRMPFQKALLTCSGIFPYGDGTGFVSYSLRSVQYTQPLQVPFLTVKNRHSRFSLCQEWDLNPYELSLTTF